MKNIAIFASGSGSNAENLLKYFSSSEEFMISAIMCNNPDAYVITRAQKLGVEYNIFNREQLWKESGDNSVIQILRDHSIDAIILAGFIPLVPDFIIKEYAGRIINIHPSLIPKYCGKGMYGIRVHEAVVAAEESETGITIHLVDSELDNGKILFQATCDVCKCDSPRDVEAKVHMLEKEHFPVVIEDYLLHYFKL